MNCRVCKQEIQAKVAPDHEDADHVRQPSPIEPGVCAGCWMFKVEMETFLVRACDRTVMGNWTEGWLREIIKNPQRYL